MLKVEEAHEWKKSCLSCTLTAYCHSSGQEQPCQPLLHSCNDSTAAARSCAFIVPGFKGLDCVMELASYYMEKAFFWGFFFFFGSR